MSCPFCKDGDVKFPNYVSGTKNNSPYAVMRMNRFGRAITLEIGYQKSVVDFQFKIKHCPMCGEKLEQ